MSARPEVIAAAEAYMAAGWNLVPVVGKAPPDKKWRKHYTPDAILARLKKSATGVGFLGGELNAGIVPLDFDSEEGERWWQEQCEAAGIPADDFPTVRTPGKILEDGTRRASGKHRYVMDVRGTLGNSQGDLKRLGIDVRGKGQCVLPPSPHPDGGFYQWEPRCSLADFEVIPECPAFVYEAIERSKKPHAEPPSNGHARTDDSAYRYCRTVLEAKRDELAHTRQGQRGSTLLRAAFNLAGYAHYGAYSENEVRATLRAACEANGLLAHDGAKTVEATFDSGWQAGLAQPREIPEREQPAKVAHVQRMKAGEPSPKLDKGRVDDGGDTALRLIPGPEFVAGFTAPDYLVDGVIQRRYLYSLTGRTGDGKTTVTIYLARCVEHGVPFAGRETAQGRVLILCGENPDDFKARLILSADAHGLKITDNLVIVPSVFDIEKDIARLTRAAEVGGNVDLVLVDTGPAYFPGDEENDNVQLGRFARSLRRLTMLPGCPAGIVNCHPTKGATRDSLVPRGGGSFLAEVDGNLTLWAETEGTTTLHHHRKFRGPGFEPIDFKLEKLTCDALKDTKGRCIPSVIARPVSDEEAARIVANARSDEDAVLDMMLNWPELSYAKWCEKLTWTTERGEPTKWRVQRAMQTLARDKLARQRRGKWELTADGKKEAKRVVENGAV